MTATEAEIATEEGTCGACGRKLKDHRKVVLGKVEYAYECPGGKK